MPFEIHLGGRVLLLNRAEVEGLLQPDELIEAVAAAMGDLSAGQASMPQRTAAIVPEAQGLLGGMLSYVPSINVLAAKLVTLFPQNAGGPLPTHQAAIVAFDPSTGRPSALIDGTAITAQRTAAGSALAARLIARPDASILAIIGTGVQAKTHARYVSRVRKFTDIRIAGRDHAKAQYIAAELTAELGRPVIASTTIEAAVEGADVVCGTVHGEDPIIRRAWIAPGTHLSSICTPGRELDEDTLRDATIFVESRATAFSPPPAGAPELCDGLRSGLLKLEHVSEIGELVSGTRKGRTSSEEVTVYRSVGVAVQDAAAVALILRNASRSGVGREISL